MSKSIFLPELFNTLNWDILALAPVAVFKEVLLLSLRSSLFRQRVHVSCGIVDDVVLSCVISLLVCHCVRPGGLLTKQFEVKQHFTRTGEDACMVVRWPHLLHAEKCAENPFKSFKRQICNGRPKVRPTEAPPPPPTHFG